MRMLKFEVEVEFTAFDFTESFIVEAVSAVTATDYVQAAHGSSDMVFVACRRM